MSVADNVNIAKIKNKQNDINLTLARVDIIPPLPKLKIFS